MAHTELQSAAAGTVNLVENNSDKVWLELRIYNLQCFLFFFFFLFLGLIMLPNAIY